MNKWNDNMEEMIKHTNKIIKKWNKSKVKWCSFSFSMKKGNIKKYKPFLDYISKNYYPEFLSISQMVWYDYMKSVPIPIIEFKAPCIDALDIFTDFMTNMNKDEVVSASSDKHKWSYKDPVLTANNLAEIHERHKKLEEMRKKEGWKK